MESHGIEIDPHLPRTDIIALETLIEDIKQARAGVQSRPTSHTSDETLISQELTPGNHRRRGSTAPASCQSPPAVAPLADWHTRRQNAVEALEALSNPDHPDFEPTVFVSTDLRDVQVPKFVNKWLLQPYIRTAQRIVRYKTDVVMLTHLILYFTTSVPSALYLLFGSFTWGHAGLHFLMQLYYMPTYTLMMHQHIHQRGVLNKSWRWLDHGFPYIIDPLMGHTWNSYFYHHVKHHHVEGNGPDDLSSTVHYQRDDIFHFLHYVGRFYFLIWLDLPLYFVRTRKYGNAARSAFWEVSAYAAMYCMWRFVNARAAFVVFILPFLLLRAAFMAGNWGQHAFVDWEDADSDYRSSITLIDVPSNRYCFNDGYHTSHHLNPLRHWRQHPVHFIREKDTYAKEKALTFHGLDFNMVTIKCLQKDYTYLAKRLVPMGDQIHMTLEEKAEMLRQHTRRFTKQDIACKFKKGA